MLSQSVLCVITGASRGYGRCLAETLAEVVGDSSLFVLLSRDEEGLSGTCSLVEAVNPNIRVVKRSVDLSAADGDDLKSLLTSVRAEVGERKYDTGLLIHNAGSIGDISRSASKMQSRDELLSYMALNVVSPMLLTSAYLDVLKCCAGRHVVVNVSSLLAVQPIASLSLYATGKAARDMFFRSLAVEEEDLKVLNWAPGPMETDLLKRVISTTFDGRTKEQFEKMPCVPLLKSAQSFIKVLSENTFESGAHIDIYDVIPPPVSSE